LANAHNDAASAGLNGALRVVRQDEAHEQLIEFISARRPERADLLELSTATTLRVIRALRDAETRVRLLVAHPDALYTTPFMMERLHNGLADLFELLGDSRAFEVRTYAVSPSLRGRSVDALIMAGWYTYRDNKRIDQSEGAITEIWGHDNALIMGDVSDPNGAALADWFRREFDRLWTHRHTRDAGLMEGR
jgi:hypothetical protein